MSAVTDCHQLDHHHQLHDTDSDKLASFYDYDLADKLHKLHKLDLADKLHKLHKLDLNTVLNLFKSCIALLLKTNCKLKLNRQLKQSKSEHRTILTQWLIHHAGLKRIQSTGWPALSGFAGFPSGANSYTRPCTSVQSAKCIRWRACQNLLYSSGIPFTFQRAPESESAP